MSVASRTKWRWIVIAVALMVSHCAKTPPVSTPEGPQLPQEEWLPSEEGIASYYAHRFNGRRTANGERFNMQAMTAAHRVLPFGTLVKVEHLATNRCITVRINDRGPFVKGRIIDLSYAAAKALGFVRSGLAKVRVTPLHDSANRSL